MEKSDLDGRFSDVLSRRMTLRTNNLSSRRFKKRLWWIRWSDFSSFRKVMQIHFLYPGHRQNRLGRIRLSDVLSRRMALRTHNLPSERLKKRLCCSRLWCFKVSNAMRNHFGHRNKRLGRNRISDVLSRRLALMTQNLSSGRLKTRFWWSMKGCFKVSKCHSNSFSTSRASKKTTWTKSLWWRFK
jgi:hypothetical protein